MIKIIFDKWASTTLGLFINMVLFIIALFIPVGPLLYCIWAWVFSVLAIYFIGVFAGWADEPRK